MAHSVAGMVVYFAMVVASVFVPLPRFGITPDVASATRLAGASGVWIDHPHRAIGAATAYFFLPGVVELTLMTWIDTSALTPR